MQEILFKTINLNSEITTHLEIFYFFVIRYFHKDKARLEFSNKKYLSRHWNKKIKKY